MAQGSAAQKGRLVNYERRMGPENVLAFYRRGDDIGKRIAEYYRDARNLPAENVIPVTINWTQADSIYMEFADFDNLTAQLNEACSDKDIQCLLSCGNFPGAVGYDTVNRDDGWGFHELIENLGIFEQYASSFICDKNLAERQTTYPTVFPEYSNDYPPDFNIFDTASAAYFAGRPPGFLFNGFWLRQLPLSNADYGIGGIPDWTRRSNGNAWARLPKNRRQFLLDNSDTMLHNGHLGTDNPGTNMTYAHIRLESCPVGTNNPDYADEFDVIKRVIDDSIAAEKLNRTKWGNTLLAGGQGVAVGYYVYNEMLELKQNVSNFNWVDMDFDVTESANFDGNTADNMPNGETRIVPGTGFSPNPVPDVFFTALGYQAYSLAYNQTPLAKGDMDFALGSIYVAGQSLGMSPIPSQDTNWFYTICDFPADFGTDYFTDKNGDLRSALNTDCDLWNRNVHGQTTGWAYTKVGTYKVRRSTTGAPASATAQMIATNILELRENGGVVATIDFNGMTLDAGYAFINDNLPANWTVRTDDGGYMSRAMAAIHAGACVATGALREPGSLAFIPTKGMAYNFYECGDCVAEASIKWNPTNGVGGFNVGYGEQFGRGIIGDPLYRPFGYLEELRLGLVK